MNKLQIEQSARELQTELWVHRRALWPNQERRPLQVLDPEAAAHVLGVEFGYFESLGRFGGFEAAGALDRQRRMISVSTRFRDDVVRFTAAHEIGHWRLHPNDIIMHRDRPVEGLSIELNRRPLKEREADYFAACFLMPDRLVREAFFEVFLVQSGFSFDEASAFELCPDDPERLLRPRLGSLDRELALASARSYRHIPFYPLAKRFGVSPTTMAIRLKELNLLRPWP